MSVMHPLVYMTYMLAFRDNEDLKNVARRWNAEIVGYPMRGHFDKMKRELREYRAKHWSEFKHQKNNWENFDVPRYMKFINNCLYFGG